MKIIVFAGGVGTRLWPLSRRSTPKQFGKIIGDRSTLQQTISRLLPSFRPEDIYVATGKRYEEIVRGQLAEIPKENFIFEPEMRDVGPAIGLMSFIMAKKNEDEPVAILWSDHLVRNEDEFRASLFLAKEAIVKKGADFVFIGQKPRFANQNIGWIETGDVLSSDAFEHKGKVHLFKRLVYRPKMEEAEEFFRDKKFVWNLGYFVTTPKFLCSLFQMHVPAMVGKLKQIQSSYGTKEFDAVLQRIYPMLEKISFDDAILVKLKPENMYVVLEDLGWSDVGAWEALKEALASTVDENVTNGNVLLKDSRDSLVFSYTHQMVVGIDLDELLVINTDDVLLVCAKSSVPKIKKLVESLSGTPNEHLT